MPPLSGIPSFSQERHYLYRKNGVVIRMQTNGDAFELERKSNVSPLVRDSEKISITKEEFDALTKIASGIIIRDTYELHTPPVNIRIYHGVFKGLVRAEVSFASLSKAEAFIPYPWLSREITRTPLAQDETLLTLSKEQFQAFLNR